MSAEFHDNSVAVRAAMNDAVTRWLYEAAHVLKSQTQQNTAVDTGQLKNSWGVDLSQADSGVATVGSPLENAVWEEFGTGEYALNGDGRKGGWFYEDDEGKGHFTRGKKPRRALHRAFETKKTPLIKLAEEIFKSEIGR